MRLSHLETDSHVWIFDKKLIIEIGMGSKKLKLKCSCQEDYDSVVSKLFEIGWYWENIVV